MSLEEELAVLAGGFVLQGAWIRKRNVNPTELVSHVRVYSGSWKWATEAPALPQELHSCGGVQQEEGASRAQDSQRDPVGVTAKGQEEKNPPPQHQPSRAWSLQNLLQGSVKLVSFVLFLFKDFSYFYKFLSLAYSLWSHMKSPKGTSVQFSLFALFHHVWWLFGPVTPSLVLPTKAAHNSAIDRNQGDFMGRAWNKRKSPPKALGNDWCLIKLGSKLKFVSKKLN